MSDAVPTRYWHARADGRVVCDLCPRACVLSEGQRGLCFVRQNIGGGVVLTTYGRSSGFCIDPIEKKPLAHFYPGSAVLSFGTAGCNLSCAFCQNWDISKARTTDRLADHATPDAIATAAAAHGCRSVAYTYNDPVIFHEYAIDVAQACAERGILSVAVTAGYVCDVPRAEFYRSMHAANVDLKAFTDDFYHRHCSARLGPVLDTLRHIAHDTETWLEITTLLIPGENDADAELDAMTGWIATELGTEIPLHLTAFHPDYRMTGHAPTPPATLRRARARARENGLRYVYTGNIRDPEGQSTTCVECGGVLIGRDGYVLTAWDLDAQGCCANCGATCAGRFDAKPGRWGARRQPITL